MAEIHVNSKTAFNSWKYRQYFTFAEVKGKNVHVICKLCPGTKKLSMSMTSNSNLTKHLTSCLPSTTLVANNLSPAAASASSNIPTPSKQKRLDFSGQQLVTYNFQMLSLNFQHSLPSPPYTEGQ
ncbi:hypothetical protein XENOCAPTIV_031009 [Xenoophorus captivus]|uniref:BED-type domain-containing protein n=1 Tax=Xenoophorus captivus TaxID=1517983 RepID=A0ABV0RMU7_9TELE